MDAKRLARQALERDLREALETGEFELFYQPVLDLRTNRIAGFEALLRWRHSERGWVAPGEFIPVAEETGLIGALGEWVLQQACRDAVSWPGSLKVSVNVSPVQFRLSRILAGVTQALASSSLPAQRLGLEITESVVLDDSGALAALLRIKALGVEISLDDFGTGYASMSYLRRFPFDRIKIDQSFVRELQRLPDSTAIVHATLDLARRLGITTTAEGVETQDQLSALRAAGCTQAQGYLIARPMPVQEIAGFLAHWTAPLS
ncbi:putative bifunctional diguanylate cyclase/phosphodiesterase [Microvirga sp. M2]|uniref:putative bifunctional diguanylate cyclase/phosphodiesterase n=1 Tax=Microvirga sp. M2 TaxID=3073270 RepID=UPI0039C3FDDB